MTDAACEAPAGAAASLVLTRNRLYGGLFLLAALNAASGAAVDAIGDLGAAGAVLALFNISAVVWMALIAGLALTWREPDYAPVRPIDLWLAGAVMLAAVLPVPAVSGVMLTVVGLHAAMTAGPGSRLRRAAIIFLAVSGTLLWGKVLLTVFTRPVLEMDSWLMSSLLHVRQEGNVVWREGGAVAAVVSTGCSSIHGISVALVCWAAICQYFAVPLDRRSILTALAAVLATMAVNMARIGGILVSPEWARIIHDGWGATVSMWVTLGLVTAICLFGARREVFAHA